MAMVVHDRTGMLHKKNHSVLLGEGKKLPSKENMLIRCNKFRISLEERDIVETKTSISQRILY